MGKPMMIQNDDDKRIERLKRKLNAKSKVQVLRSALDLLEAQVEKAEKLVKWARAAKIVSASSREVMEDFKLLNLLKSRSE